MAQGSMGQAIDSRRLKIFNGMGSAGSGDNLDVTNTSPLMRSALASGADGQEVPLLPVIPVLDLDFADYGILA